MFTWLSVSAVLVGAFVLTGVIRWGAIRVALLDIPNQRSSHTLPIPRGGGLAIVVAFLFGLLASALVGLLPWGLAAVLTISSLLVAGIGFWDDLRQLSATRRIVVHFLAAVLLILGLAGGGCVLPAPWPIAPLPLLLGLGLVLVVIWSLNLFNFMDGIDGLAGSEATFVAGAASLLLALGGEGGEMLLLLLLAAACLGFLVWNWPPARIFLGDVGSGFLGFVLAALALQTSVFSPLLPVYCWLILPGVFLTDATVTLLRRMLRGDKWYAAHRSHAYQHAAAMSSHLRVTLVVMVLNLFWLLPLSVLCVIFPRFGVLLTIAAYLPLLSLAIKFTAGVENSTVKASGTTGPA